MSGLVWVEEVEGLERIVESGCWSESEVGEVDFRDSERVPD